jgi:adenosylhomocysteine nucleosidase
MKSEVRSPKSERTTLVCLALKEEAAAFRKISAGKSDASILVTGIGRKNAEKSVCGFLSDNTAERVFTCGFAGGLNPQLAIGDVVFFAEEPALREKLLVIGAKPTKFFCADRIATTVAEKEKLRAETGADAVEMESEAIHKVCRERGIPCATVRAISDTAHEDLPLEFNQLAKPDLSLDYARLALAIVRSPAKIPALLRLQKNSRFAAQQLAAVLAKVIWPR